MALTGSSDSRQLLLGVKVDDAESVALSVVSQGELHALALAVFLPRPLRPESPFRFLIIDDPVQAMDPAHVEGLARLLAQVAEVRQVIVFTHDSRLADALLKLDITHQAISFTRSAGSAVRVEVRTNPWDEALNRALRISLDQKLPDAIARRVVGGFLRQAVEAVSHRTFIERELHRGANPDLAEATFTQAKTLVKRVALARDCEDGALYPRLNNEGMSGGVDTLKMLNAGSHGALNADLNDAVRDTKKLVAAIQQFNGKPSQ